ncbi:hypothetical protein K0504_14485 [Neiella marina]|uniref:TFIIS-type domain-containing protein n=1 Tax=Neiella holothuriorum TaxID=2870530 RepID=A0ABS7EIS9_9GAMM|nr:hypothetical protein [Neiella holothuriorum]MBW8192241.1 hypothetical protein [Neiella holothuriorum]
MFKERLKRLLQETTDALAQAFSANQTLADDWQRLPTQQEYMAKHEGSVLDASGVACHHCGSGDIAYRPLQSAKGRRLVHFCTSCKRALFRSMADF